MTRQRWRRGESRERILAATLAAVAEVGPGGVSGRSIARAAGVHNAQIQQMFGSVDELVTEAVVGERDRFIELAFAQAGTLPDPLALGRFPLFWRSIAQVLLDPGPVDLRHLAEGGPVALLRDRLVESNSDRAPITATAIAAAWAAAPLGALIFESPLRRGLGIGDGHWERCWKRMGARIESLADLPSLPPGPGRGAPPPLPDRPAGERGRERLLRAAEELLGSRLETSVTGRELAAEAGVNYGLVNHYFGSKSAAFDEALSNLHQRFLGDILAVGRSPAETGPFQVFFHHRAFLRAWASRLLGGRQTPDFQLLGMERLMSDLLAARRIDPEDDTARVGVAGDALAAVALQLGWTILQPLPSAVDPDGVDEVVAELGAIHAWLLSPPAGVDTILPSG